MKIKIQTDKSAITNLDSLTFFNDTTGVIKFNYSAYEFNICKNENSAIIFLDINEEFADTVYSLLDELYTKAYVDTTVEFDGLCFDLTDAELLNEFYVHIYRDGRGFDYRKKEIISELVKDKGISSFNELVDYAKQPFSGYMPIDKHYRQLVLRHEDDKAALSEEIECIDINAKNRIIESDLNIKKTNHVQFWNCIIIGDLNLTSIKSLSFHNCIVKGTVFASDVERLEVSECNIENLVVNNSTLNKVRIVYSNIYDFIIQASMIKETDWLLNKFEHFSVYDTKINAAWIDLKQFIFHKIDKANKVKKERKTMKAPDSFYMKFQYKNTASTRLDELTKMDLTPLGTYLFLQENINPKIASVEEIANIDYKVAYYKAKRLKRFFVLFTGGFLKPNLWIMYYIVWFLVCFGLYLMPMSQFVSNGQPIILSTSETFLYALRISLYIPLSNFEAVSFASYVTTFQVLINPLIIGSFFTAIIKRLKLN